MLAPDQEGTTISSGEALRIPWTTLLKQVPAEFLKRPLQDTPVRGSYFISKEVAVRQLAQGAVKVPLGDIRRAAPPGILVESDKGDHQLISLPLRDVLRRIRPEMYVRRPDQRRVDVPESVGDLFGPRGQTLSAVRILKKEDLRKSQTPVSGHSTSFLRKATPQHRESPAAPLPPETPRPGLAEVQPGTIAVPDALKLAMQMHPPAPTKAPAASAPGASSGLHAPPAPQRTAGPAPAPILPRLGRSPEKRAARPLEPATPSPAPPPTVSPSARPGTGQQVITVPVAEISAQWPEAIRQEITHLHLDAAQCQLPVGEIMTTAKQGRMAFPWRKIRTWIQPGPPTSYVSKQDATVLEIPIQAVVPSFLQGRSTPEPRPAKPAPAAVPDVLAARPMIAHSPQIPPPPSGATEFRLRTSAAPSGAPETRHFSIPLADVSTHWPGQVLQEIQRLNLADASLEIPVDILEADLKTGRIDHCWIQICSWIAGFPDTADTSHHASIHLELPLSVIAPRYFKTRQATGGKKSYVPNEIPDLFNFNAPPPPPPSPAAESAPTPAAEPAPAAPPVPTEPEKPAKKKLPSNIAELFGEPKKRNWTPNEIVHKAAEIEGVAGALIALQDGLLVASCMPPEWKSETVAAFLPQMFGRMKQYARELNAGELKSIAIAVEKGHLEVFNAGLIYFSVLGFPDVPLPLPELTIIATELSRHTK
jgi:predicted regulator of Ras-like GTPase activity (Roadblock/LC7/MglB family)